MAVKPTTQKAPRQEHRGWSYPETGSGWRKPSPGGELYATCQG